MGSSGDWQWLDLVMQRQLGSRWLVEVARLMTGFGPVEEALEVASPTEKAL